MVYLSLSISTIFLEGLFLLTSSDIPLIVSIVLTAFPVPSNLSTISAPIGVDLKASSIEAMFKAFAKSLDEATCFDPRINDVLSTKGAL